MDEETRAFEEWAKTNSNKAVLGVPVEKEEDTETADFEKWAAQQEVMPTPAPIEKKSRDEYLQLMKESEDKVKRANSVKNFSDYYLHNYPTIKGMVDYFTEGKVEDEINYVDNLKFAMDKNVSPELIRQYRSAMKKDGMPNFNMMEKSGEMSFAAKLTNWLEVGELQRQVALKSEQHRKAKAGSPEEERLGKEVAALVEKMEKATHEQALPDNAIEDAYKLVGEILPGMVHTLGISSTKGMLITSLIAGAGYVAGAKLTVPATLMAGAVSTSYFVVEESAKKEAGNLYLSLLKEKDENGNKLDPNYCKWAAGLGGWAAGGLELVQFRSLARLYPGSSKLVARALTEAFKSKALRQKFASLAMQLPVESGKQTIQEIRQGIATEIVATEFVKQLNNLTEGTNFKSADIAKVANVIIDNLKTYPAFLAMGAPGTAMRMAGVTGKAVVGDKDKKTTFADKEDLTQQEESDTLEEKERSYYDYAGRLFEERGIDPATAEQHLANLRGNKDLTGDAISTEAISILLREGYITAEEQAILLDHTSKGIEVLAAHDKKAPPGSGGKSFTEEQAAINKSQKRTPEEVEARLAAKQQADEQRELAELDETAAESLDMLDENDRAIMAGWGNMKSLPNGEVVYQKTGEGTQLNPARAPENPLIVQNREGLADFLKYEGDPYSAEFDKIAKDYAEQDNRDGIIYADTKDGTPEMRVFTKREGTSFIIKGQDPTEALKDKSLTFKKFDAFFEEMDARRQELENEVFIGEPTDKAIKEMADTSGTNELFRERMYELYEQARDEETSMLLSMASRMTKKQGENLRALDQYASMDDEASSIAVQKAIDKVSRKLGSWRRKAIALAKENIRHLPLYSAMEYIVKKGGLNEESLKLVYPEVAADIAKRRPGLVSKKGTLKADEIAQEFAFEDADSLVEGIFEWKGLENEAIMAANAELEQILQMLGETERDGFLQTYREEKEAALKKLSEQNKPRPAKGIGKVIKKETGITRDDSKQVTEYEALTAGYGRAREAANVAVRWSFRRRAEMRNIQEFLHLTDAQMQKVSRRNPYLMTDAEYADYKAEVLRRAVELQDNMQAKAAVSRLIEEKQLKKVDNFRRLLGYPALSKMTTEQANEYFEALDKYQEGDVFLSPRLLETVERSETLRDAKTHREVMERMAAKSGKNPADLLVADVPNLALFMWDSLLKRQGTLWDIFVSRITEATIIAESSHAIAEDGIRRLGKKAHQSRKRSLKERVFQTDEVISKWLRAEAEERAAIEEGMTKEELDMAAYLRVYFAQALEWLQQNHILKSGLEEYMTNFQKGFFESIADEGLRKAIASVHERLKDSRLRFRTFDENGQALSPEKHFVYALHRSGKAEPTNNIIKAFSAYSSAFERMKMLNEVLPELMALTQVVKEQNPENKAVMESFVKDYLNNKKGIRVNFSRMIPQGSLRDRLLSGNKNAVGMWILGGNPFVGTASIIGEQVMNNYWLGHKKQALGEKRRWEKQGKKIIEEQKAWVGRTVWDELTAAGQSVGDRIATLAYAEFAYSTRVANEQFLLAMLTDAEYESGQISPARLAQIKLEMGRVRVVQGEHSVIGSTSVGKTWTQFLGWAIKAAEVQKADLFQIGAEVKAKGFKAETFRQSDAVIRLIRAYSNVLIIAGMALLFYPDEDDKSYMGRSLRYLFREATTSIQALFSLGIPVLVPIGFEYTSDLSVALYNTLVGLATFDEKQRKKGMHQLKRFKPGVLRVLPEETKEKKIKEKKAEW